MAGVEAAVGVEAVVVEHIKDAINASEQEIIPALLVVLQ